jgi:NADH dehydrogenase [ubiquinone] 1 alpha subcomplex assembly factor 7
MEVSPESLTLIQDIALRINECYGSALIIDYGNAHGSTDTLRAFSKHEQVHVLSQPGLVDVTADVDFQAMKNAVNVDYLKRRRKRQDGRIDDTDDNSNKWEVEAFGPKTQGGFLSSMGAVERTVQLIENDETTDEQAEDLCTALERLVSVDEMGERFKVLSISRKKDDIFPPPGF